MSKFLITGMGHSGTNWIADKLTDAGVYTTHESVYPMALGKNEWDTQAGEASWPSALRLAMEHDREVTVLLHQTRHPLHVARTFFNATRVMPEWAFPYLHIERDKADPHRCFGEFYTRWNRLVEQLASEYEYHRFQVESLVHCPEAVAELLDHLGVDPRGKDLDWSYKMREEFEYPILPWESYSHVWEFITIAKDYGYLDRIIHCST
jgi:hypothetical protein